MYRTYKVQLDIMCTMEDADDKWAAYYARLKDRPPRFTSVFAARRFCMPGFAVDLGAGGGRDALPLLTAGWRVLAIDREPAAIAAIQNAVPNDLLTALSVAQQNLEEAEWPECDLLNSSFALPLCKKIEFPHVWQKIIDRLGAGGRFSGQLYGDRDTWAKDGAEDGVVAFTRSACLAQLNRFDIEFFEEEEHDGVTPRGKIKHWHIFHIVARKRS